ncbi:anthranilate phosphoribosyltransferase [Psychrosphaera saromensis]|uniref:Anthranilate phosphoribosyltransferase n=2 Tax=Psychrosphaera saromensis TaxID=716813 RepID=A0A2S7UZ47_9GAMM|nr:anthranilate phosphoribosyltransferase [Psychrosphaera saromensis]
MTNLELIHNVIGGADLTSEQTHQLFTHIVTGELDPILLSSYLTALKIKGETVFEIAGAAKALSDNALAFPSHDFDTADNCGTGGDGTKTINISTMCAILAASCGVKMAKHGNRAVSSKSGSADVLSELGIKLDMTPEQAKTCLEQTNLTFLMAPVYHSGIRHAMPVRQMLQTRTIFNILGPLINPASAAVQVLGVYDPELCRPIAESLKLLGKKAAWVVHGSGMDEIALHGKTKIVQLLNGEITEFEMTPEDVGLKSFPLEALTGGTPKQNAENIHQVLSGNGTQAHTFAVALNTAPVLFLYGLCDSFEQALETALAAIKSGQAIQTLENFVALSNRT